MQGFLLDSHVPSSVADGVRNLRPDCLVEQLSRWRAGEYRNAADEDIMAAARSASVVLVTYDRGTIPSKVHQWLADGRPVPAVALISSRGAAQNDIGSVVRAVVGLYDDLTVFDPAYPVVYLHPAR